MTDKGIVRSIQNGNVRGLEELMNKYAAYVGTIVRRMVLPSLSESDAEEITADVFVSMWRNPDQLTAENLKSYLAATARNRSMSRLRSAKQFQPLDEEVLEVRGDVEKEVDRRLLARALAEALAEMERSDRDILVNTYYYCHSLKEIAAEWEITEGAAKTRLFRARSRLKKILMKRGIVYED